MKHGAGRKWYLNAQHYSDEIVEKYNLRDYLMEQYKNFEQVSVRKVHGFNAVGLDYKLRIPIIGRIIKHTAQKMLHSTKPPVNPLRAEGHIGQVVPLEDGIAILEECAAEPMINKNCMCGICLAGLRKLAVSISELCQRYWKNCRALFPKRTNSTLPGMKRLKDLQKITEKAI